MVCFCERCGQMPRSSPFSSEVRKEILRKERSGFRQKAPARKGRTLTPSNRLKLSPAGHVRHSRARAPAPHVGGVGLTFWEKQWLRPIIRRSVLCVSIYAGEGARATLGNFGLIQSHR